MSPPVPSPADVAFRPVREADFPLMTAWLMQPHVRAFYQRLPITVAEVAEEYGPAVRGEEPSLCHLALSEGRPFGYFQSYLNSSYPEYGDLIGGHDGLSVDLYIGEPAFLHGGWGRAALAAYLHDVAFPAFPTARRAYIAHEPVNERALRCSRAVGFKPLREFIEDGTPDLLLVLERPLL